MSMINTIRDALGVPDEDLDAEAKQEEQDRFLIDERMKALASVYQLADSIIAGEKISVSVGSVPQAQAPAWTSGAEIFINTATISLEDFDDIVRLHGLNFHELSHVLFTPRAGTNLSQFCMDNGLMPAFNMLEDQRIESLMTTKYPSTAPWLTAAIMRWVTSDQTALDKGYMFVRGRRYLPGELRGMLRSVFGRKDLLADIDRIVDTYRLLVFPTDYDAAKPLIEQMQRILEMLGSPFMQDPNGHGHAPWHVCDKGRPAPVREQRSLRDRMGSESPKANDNKPEGEPGEDRGMGKDHDGVSGDSGEEPADNGRSQQGEDSGQPSTDSSAGIGSGSVADELMDAARQRAQEMLDALLKSDEVVDDIRRTRLSIEGATETPGLPTAINYDREPLPEFALMERHLTSTMTLLQQEAEPGWHRREDHGRLNVVRWTIERDIEEAFDRWDEGVTDAVDIEAVILLDSSGSMGAVLEEASNAMWVLKRAFDAVEMSTTVIAYDSTSETVYEAQERAGMVVRRPAKCGGTNPIGGLNQAARIFKNSSRKHHLLVVLTDGQWSNCTDQYGMTSHDYIKRMNEAGVSTVLGFIDAILADRIEMGQNLEELIEENRHHCKIAGLAQGDNLVPFISNMVTDLIRCRIRVSR